MVRVHSTLPAWVLYGGKHTLVSTFEGIAPKDRPVVQCPGCQNEVILKIGKINPPHYAHKPNSWCNESALHLNSKMNLVEQLEKGNRLSCSVPCGGGCGDEKQIPLFNGWNQVKPEFTLGNIRPDVMLLKAGQPIGCIEVTHTHSMGIEKEQFLFKANIPTLELEASEGLCNWEYQHSIPMEFIITILGLNDSILRYICEGCKKVRDEQLKKEQQESNQLMRSLEEFNRDRKIITLAACCWDIYLKDGRRYRESFQARAEYKDGVITRKWIEDKKGRSVCSISSPDENDSALLNLKLEEYVESIIPRNQYEFIDHRMNWKKVNQKYSYLDARDHCRIRYKYRFDIKSRCWVER
jgi:hypothetical protein